MNKNLAIYAIIPLIVFVAFFNVFSTSSQIDYCELSIDGLELNYNLEYDNDQFSSVNSDFSDCYAATDLGKSFVGFKEAIAFKESRGDYKIVNTLGYLGKYQFGKSALRTLGINDDNMFLNSPELQEQAFIALASINKWILRRDIKRFVGKRIDGVLVTESGILAAAHLAGAGSVKKYLRSFGAIGFTDAYGTHIRSYMRKFSGYDTSFIKPDKSASVTIL